MWPAAAAPACIRAHVSTLPLPCSVITALLTLGEGYHNFHHGASDVGGGACVLAMLSLRPPSAEFPSVCAGQRAQPHPSRLHASPLPLHPPGLPQRRGALAVRPYQVVHPRHGAVRPCLQPQALPPQRDRQGRAPDAPEGAGVGERFGGAEVYCEGPRSAGEQEEEEEKETPSCVTPLMHRC